MCVVCSVRCVCGGVGVCAWVRAWVRVRVCVTKGQNITGTKGDNQNFSSKGCEITTNK